MTKVKFTIYVDTYIVKIAKAQLVRGEASRICEQALAAAIKAVNIDQEIEEMTKKIKQLSEIKQLPVKEISVGEAIADLAKIFYDNGRDRMDRQANMNWIGSRSLAYRSLRGVPTASILEQIENIKGEEDNGTKTEGRSKKKN